METRRKIRNPVARLVIAVIICVHELSQPQIFTLLLSNEITFLKCTIQILLFQVRYAFNIISIIFQSRARFPQVIEYSSHFCSFLKVKPQRTQAESKPRVVSKGSKKSDQQLVPDEEEQIEKKEVTKTWNLSITCFFSLLVLILKKKVFFERNNKF